MQSACATADCVPFKFLAITTKPARTIAFGVHNMVRPARRFFDLIHGKKKQSRQR